MFIYALIDPRSSAIRYIGKTSNLKERLRVHLRDRKPSHKRNWIASLTALKLTPIIEVIEIVSLDDWREAERFWISYLRFVGVALTNTARGGDGADSVSEATRARHSAHSKSHPNIGPRMTALNESRRGIPLSPEHRAKISAGGKGVRRSAETRERMSKARMGIRYSFKTRFRMSLAKRGIAYQK